MRITHKYTKVECTLDTIQLVEFCVQGARLKWCKNLVDELLLRCVKAHKNTSDFIYGYFLLGFFMRPIKNTIMQMHPQSDMI